MFSRYYFAIAERFRREGKKREPLEVGLETRMERRLELTYR